MKQFVPQTMPDSSGIVFLGLKDIHYLTRVRRYEKGTHLTLLLKDGSKALGILDQIPTGEWVVTLDKVGSQQSEDSSELREPELHLILGYPKGKKLELSIRQATELGVATIYPVITDNAIPDLGPKEWEKKRERLEGILREAAQQSNCSHLPKLSNLLQLQEVLDIYLQTNPLDASSETLGVFFHEKPLAQKSLSHYLLSKPKHILVAVGPEGGFSPKEVQQFLDAGCIPGYLGSTILRCETAVVAALAAVKILSLEA